MSSTITTLQLQRGVTFGLKDRKEPISCVSTITTHSPLPYLPCTLSDRKTEPEDDGKSIPPEVPYFVLFVDRDPTPFTRRPPWSRVSLPSQKEGGTERRPRDQSRSRPRTESSTTQKTLGTGRERVFVGVILWGHTKTLCTYPTGPSIEKDYKLNQEKLW